MRTVCSQKIDVQYIDNPYQEVNIGDKASEQWPILFINNKLCKLQAIEGIRPKFFYKKQFVVKFNDFDGIHTVNGIKKLYSKIIKNGDAEFFPEILAYDIKNGFIIQKYIPLTTKGITNTHKSLVKLLTKKYNLEDVITGNKHVWNWALNAKTKNVVIYDFVA